jgi:NADPH:quinone reductase-like Zn-dependent oxidoreductase
LLAKWQGAFVIGTAHSANAGYLAKLGADQVVDYSPTPFEQEVGKVNVVIDLVGGETLERSYGVVNRGGMIISTGQPVSVAKMQSLEIRGL